jgi:hypothetical protein
MIKKMEGEIQAVAKVLTQEIRLVKASKKLA